MSFEAEYHRRIRRALGVFDDETSVYVYEETRDVNDSGCDTCGYGAADPYTIEIVIVSHRDGTNTRVADRKFNSMDEFLNELFSVNVD